MKRVAFIGSGEMAITIKRYLEEESKYDIVGYIDDLKTIGEIIDGKPIICNSKEAFSFYKSTFDYIVIAIGFEKFEYREQYFNLFFEKIPFLTYIHPSCVISKSSNIKEGVIMLPGCIVDHDVCIEENVFMHLSCTVSHNTIVKRHTYLSPEVKIAGFSHIGEKCNMGINTTVSDRIKVCDFVRTGACAVVVKDITEPGTYVGVPARKIKDTI